MIIYFTSVIIYPKQPINFLKKHLNLNVAYSASEDASSMEYFTHNNMTHMIYYYYNTSDDTSDTIIIDLPGGAFISSSNTFIHYKHIDQPYSVISIEYPVLPDGIYMNAISYIQEAISYVISLDQYKDKKIILSAASAGCYYAVKIINSEKFKDLITKFISLSGYFGYKTMPNVGTYLTEKFYLRKKNLKTNMNCTPIHSNVKTFYAVARYDNLKESTYEFLKMTGAQNEIIEYASTDHCFYLRYNDMITQSLYSHLSEFIKN